MSPVSLIVSVSFYFCNSSSADVLAAGALPSTFNPCRDWLSDHWRCSNLSSFLNSSSVAAAAEEALDEPRCCTVTRAHISARSYKKKKKDVSGPDSALS